MQNHDSVQEKIEHLLVKLSCCVNDLHGLRRNLFLEDIKQAELSVQKLNALISYVSNQSSPLRLVAG